MSDTESFLIVDDLIGSNEKIDMEKLEKIANDHRQTNTYCEKDGVREYSCSIKFSLVNMEKELRAIAEEMLLTEDAKREFNPKTRTLPYFEIDDEWQKYVEIEDE
jgi:hypothetical protein